MCVAVEACKPGQHEFHPSFCAFSFDSRFLVGEFDFVAAVAERLSFDQDKVLTDEVLLELL